MVIFYNLNVNIVMKKNIIVLCFGRSGSTNFLDSFVENEKLNYETAEKLKEVTEKHSIPFIYKSSLYKANRTSHNSYTGIGYSKGLEILNKIKSELNKKSLTTIKTPVTI